ncbi:hypothetical protein T492DRAFT_848173 [Pavlovales sp. CCMP2436]|nr:hypothetical protein T492DRAFT_848173 [Pavlovales sp. CCMP2436]
MSGLRLGKLVPKIIFERRLHADYANSTQNVRATLLAHKTLGLRDTAQLGLSFSRPFGIKLEQPVVWGGVAGPQGWVLGLWSHRGSFIVVLDHFKKTPNGQRRVPEVDVDMGGGHNVRHGGLGDRPGA